MTTAQDLDYEDGNEDDLEPRRQRNGENNARRLAERERDEARQERDALKAENAALKRGDALRTTVADLNAEGPLGAFLRTYIGEPDADAIKTAVAADPDFSGLITFPPDPRDVAAAEQAKNGQIHAAGNTVSGQITPEDYVGWDMARQVRFMEEHPDAWERLSTGEPVVAIPGW